MNSAFAQSVGEALCKDGVALRAGLYVAPDKGARYSSALATFYFEDSAMRVARLIFRRDIRRRSE